MKKGKMRYILAAIILVFACALSACGKTALSAYDIAVKNGFVGTEVEWLESLKGENGRDGQKGKDGTNADGITIQELYQAAVSDGFDGTLSDFIKQYVGENLEKYDQQAAVNRALLSVGVVRATFSTSPSYGQYGFEAGEDSTSAGACVIYQLDKENGDAYLITNYHVVYSASSTDANGIAKKIKVYFYGYEYDSETLDYGVEAKYVGGSMTYDIAVLKITGSDVLRNGDFRAVKIADSNSVATGSTVFAVGNPAGAGISASLGILSKDSEYINMKAADDKTTVTFRCLRVDCAVNPGNSGGGLFDADGNLLGIVNAKINTSVAENIAYAIPSAIAVKVADNIVWNCSSGEKRGVSKGLMGITLYAAASSSYYDEALSKTVIVEDVTVKSVTEGSLAYGSILENDIILSISKDGTETTVSRMYICVDYMLAVRPGDVITVKVKRNDGGEQKVLTFTFTLEEKHFANIL